MELEIERTWGERGWTPSAPLTSWSALTQSDFYSWFGWHEVGRTDLGEGRAMVHLKPGGHQEAIDLAIVLDAQQSVRQASLLADRFWLDDGRTAKVADDLYQSFLLAFGGRHPESGALARAIFAQVRGSQPIVLAASMAQTLPETHSPSVQRGLAAYRFDEEGVLELAGPDVTIVLDNIRSIPEMRLIVEVLAAVAPRRRWAQTDLQIRSEAAPSPPPPPPTPPPPPVKKPWWRLW